MIVDVVVLLVVVALVILALVIATLGFGDGESEIRDDDEESPTLNTRGED